MTNKKILVILPAFNEGGTIAKTLAEIKQLDFSVDVVVINDGSTDDTAIEAQQAGAVVISLPLNLGIGGAVQTGLLYAQKHGYETAAQVDGDGQHDVRYLKTILEPVLAGQAELIIGSRFLGTGAWRSSAIRRVGIHFFAWLISGLTGYKVTDPTSGFRAFNVRAIAAFAQDYPQDFPEPEAIVMARRLNFRLFEQPVEMRRRTHGHSSIRYLKTLYYMIKVTFAILLDMIKKPKVQKP